MRILGKDGHYRWHRITLVPLKRDIEIAEWIVTALDIDEMVRARDELQQATDLFSLSQEAAGAGSWDLDLRNGAVRLSRESARLHGIGDHAVEMDLDRWKQVVDAEDAEAVLEALQAAVESRTTFNGEFRVRMADSQSRWLSGIGRAYYDVNGDPVRMIGLNFDITDRKTAEERLLRANVEAQDARDRADEARREAERASTAKSDFLASMSHEIRTPLNSIIGYTDLLMEDVDHGTPIRRKLEVIQESGVALLTVVNDILDFSKIEAGQIDLDPIVFSPRALVANVCSMLSGSAYRKRITLTQHISLNVPAFVVGDESRLRQILLNLVNNALKFTDAGHVAINMERQRPTGSDGVEMIRLSVKDTGMGISVERQRGLFQRFSQLDSSINRRFGGTGLGLAICKQLVDLMQGEIGVKSREGDGATFWFRVPMPHAEEPIHHESRPADRSTCSGGARILLVEDVEVNQELAKTVLERAGHVVDVASNGLEAVKAVCAKSYDLVLMDVQMPVMDGISATKAIRASNHASRTIPIIAMTANVLPQQVAGLKTSGMDDHVGKPFRRPELLAAIDRWTNRTPPIVEKEPPPPESQSERLDHTTFSALEDLIGAPSFRVVVAKFLAEVTVRFKDRQEGCDVRILSQDAHSIIQAAGLLGFTRFLNILRQFISGETPIDPEGTLLRDLEMERSQVIADLESYLSKSNALPG